MSEFFKKNLFNKHLENCSSEKNYFEEDKSQSEDSKYQEHINSKAKPKDIFVCVKDAN